MWTIVKQFDFCYGHRVWSQILNSEFSLDTCLKCRHLHGHQGVINISLEAEELQGGMVTDFKHLNWFKKWLDDSLDHKFIMALNDPVRYTQFPLSTVDQLTRDPSNNFWILKKESFIAKSIDIREIYEGLVFVHFVPTSENLAKWIFDIVQEKMKSLNVKVSKVQFFETPKSQSNYSI